MHKLDPLMSVFCEKSKVIDLVQHGEKRPSKKGKIFTTSDTGKFIKSNDPILFVFGTTNKGIHEILGTDIKKIQNSKIINFFPNQATQTVRLEEAILGILSIINSYNYNKL